MLPGRERIRSFPRRAYRRVRPVAAPIGQTALAAGGAWFFAGLIPGHTAPIFAPIAAVVAMTAGRGRRGRAAVQLIFGVAFGIALATLLVRGIGLGPWQLIVVVALTMTAAVAVGLPTFMVTQSAVWSVIVVTSVHGRLPAAEERLVDALVGGGVALLLAQVLFPLDPLRLVSDTARGMQEELRSLLRDVAVALRDRDEERALAAVARADDLDGRRLADALELARDVSRRAPRRRRAGRLVENHDDLARRLRDAARDVRILAVGAVRLIRSDGAIPPAYPDALEALAAHRPPRLPHGAADGIAAGIVEQQIAALTQRLQPDADGDTARHDGAAAAAQRSGRAE